jgi:hypothetical protein
MAKDLQGKKAMEDTDKRNKQIASCSIALNTPLDLNIDTYMHVNGQKIYECICIVKYFAKNF